MGILVITEDDVAPSTLPTFTNSAVALPVWPYLRLGFSIPKITQIYFWGNWEGVYGNGHSLLCKGTVPEN